MMKMAEIKTRDLNLLILLGFGLLYLRNNNHDVTRNGVADYNDKAWMILGGAALLMVLYK